MGGLPVRLAAVEAPEAIPEPEINDELRELEAVSLNLETHTLSANTRRAYESAWRSFEEFCGAHDLDPLPAHPETVRWYVAWMSMQLDEHGLPRFSRSASVWPVSRIGICETGCSIRPATEA